MVRTFSGLTRILTGSLRIFFETSKSSGGMVALTSSTWMRGGSRWKISKTCRRTTTQVKVSYTEESPSQINQAG